MSKYATEKGGSLQDLDELFKAGSGSGTTYFSQDGQDLAQRYAPFSVNKLTFDTGFVARDGRDLRDWFESRPPQADMEWATLYTASSTAVLPPHEAGDLIIIMAYRSGSTTAPTLATGYTSIDTQTNSTYVVSARLGYKWAQSSSESGGPWANAVSCLATVIKRASAYVKFTESSSQWPSLTLSAPGKSVVFHVGASGADMTGHPDDTPLFNDNAVYAGYTGLVSTMPAATAGGNNFRMCWTLEISPRLTFVPEIAANTATPTETLGTVEFPPHEAGDLLIVAAGWRDNASPSIPADSGMSLVINSGSQLYVNGTIVSKVAASNNEYAGTWGPDVTTLIGIVVKGCDGIGARNFAWLENAGLGNRIRFPAITMQRPAQSGILTIGFSNNQSGTNGLVGPSSLQVVTNLAYQPQAARADSSTALFTSWAEVTLNAPSNVNVGFTLELFVTGAPKPVDGTVILGTQTYGYGFNNGQWGGGDCGSWTGNPANLTGLMAWDDGTDETWLSFGGAQYGTFNSITLSLDGGPPVQFNWFNTDKVYYAIGDPLGLFSKTKGLPYTLVSTGVAALALVPIQLSGDISPPVPPDDPNVRSSTPVSCAPYSSPAATPNSANPVNLPDPLIEP